MSILAWCILGLIAGFIASHLVDNHGEGLLMDVVLGVVGALVGGWLFTAFGSSGVDGLNVWSVFVSVIGACVFLAIYHALMPARRLTA